MANYTYYEEQQHFDGNHHTGVHLKPIPQASAYSLPPHTSATAYVPIPVPTAPYYATTTPSQHDLADAKLKHRIRLLRFAHRALSALLSLATLTPLTITLAKFYATKDTYFSVDGVDRTAWASGTITWYTYLLFATALISFLTDLAVVLSYCCGGAARANKVSHMGGWWTKASWVGEIVIWIVSVAIYRYGKEAVDGKFRDLWGWTCSPAAKAIQARVHDLDFDQYCAIQSSSFYSGILKVVAGLVSALILVMAVLRGRSKKRVQAQGRGIEPLRS